MSEEIKDQENVVSNETESAEQQGVEDELENDFDESVLCPDESAPAQPYYAIMALDENGSTNGQLWGVGDKLMLFDKLAVAETTLKAINHPDYAIRGVTKEHLEALMQLVEQGVAELYVMAGITPKGSLEAMPLKDHQDLISKAGSPPPPPAKKP
ncbi:MAG: hypothetical protein WC966_03815 [Bradymonadales bacterium]|jgi:hypothetical protein